MDNPDFLKKKYDLHNSEEVKKAARRTEIRTGEKVPQNPSDQIQNYLDRFKEIIDLKDPEKRERGMEALKQVLHDKFVIKPEEIPESYFENQRRIAREQGHGDIEITKEAREQLTEVVIADQRSTLDNWIDYLSSPDATYPDWLKYYAFRSIVGMGEYDKEKKAFAKRSKGTTKPFPDINREALAYVLDAISQKYGKRHIDLLALQEEEKKDFEKLLQGENFPKLYAWALEKLTIAPSESLEKVAGKWIKYPQKSDHMPLVESLQGHGTGWCTAGELTAKTQLQGGDFYVYYSLDQKGKPTVPRAAIRMQGDQIGEVRGIAAEQNLDPYISSVVQEKLKEFPDGASYEKKTEDMKLLTAIENKVKHKQELNKDDLVFLYEINSGIEGFGYKKDPRVEELRKDRNLEEDMLVIFDCTKAEIAHVPNEINANTKAYVGIWNPEVLKLLPKNIINIYKNFPFKNVFLGEIIPDREIVSAETALVKIEAEGHRVGDHAKTMLARVDWEEKIESSYHIVSFSVEELFGDTKMHTYADIKTKAEENGLDLVPAALAPEICLNYEKNGEITIAMNPIRESNGDLVLFSCNRNGSGSCLESRGGQDDGSWGGKRDRDYYDSEYDSVRFFFVRSSSRAELATGQAR